MGHKLDDAVRFLTSSFDIQVRTQDIAHSSSRINLTTAKRVSMVIRSLVWSVVEVVDCPGEGVVLTARFSFEVSKFLKKHFQKK